MIEIEESTIRRIEARPLHELAVGVVDSMLSISRVTQSPGHAAAGLPGKGEELSRGCWRRKVRGRLSACHHKPALAKRPGLRRIKLGRSRDRNPGRLGGDQLPQGACQAVADAARVNQAGCDAEGNRARRTAELSRGGGSRAGEIA